MFLIIKFKRHNVSLFRVLPECPWLAVTNNEADPKLVDVIKIDWSDFSATVIELKENNENVTDMKLNLSLLFPVGLNNDKNGNRMASEALDHFRFFLNNLWFPWDEEEADNDELSISKFIEEHLIFRVSYIKAV